MSDAGFGRRVLIASALALGAFALFALLVRHPEIALLLFGGILGAVFLDALAWPLRRWLGAPRGIALLTVVSLLFVALGLTIWLIGPQIAEQGAALVDRVPELLSRVREFVPARWRGEGSGAADPVEAIPRNWQRLAPYVFGSLAGVLSSSVAVVGGALAVFALSVFLALEPARYREASLMLLPAARRERMREVLDAVAHALRWWLVGRAAAMAIVALLTGIGLALLDVPLALSLALIAGVLTFVPYIGAPLAAAPAVGIALSVSPQQALSVAALYVGIQLVENYAVTPIVQGRTISMPPALLVVAQVSLGVLLGGLGLLLSTPLAVAAVVLTQALYVQDVLGERVQLLGQQSARGGGGRTARSPERAGPKTV